VVVCWACFLGRACTTWLYFLIVHFFFIFTIKVVACGVGELAEEGFAFYLLKLLLFMDAKERNMTNDLRPGSG